MEITYQLQIADVKASEQHFSRRHENRAHRRFIASLVCLGLGVPTAIFLVSSINTPRFQTAFTTRGWQAFGPLLFAGLPLLLFLGLWLLAPIVGQHLLKKSPLMQQLITLRVDKRGLHAQSSALWSQIRGIEETPTHIFVVFEPKQIFIIPKRAFASEFEATQFVAKCRDLWAIAK